VRTCDLRSCPSPETLQRFLAGDLERNEALDLERHLETCAECRFIVSETAILLRELAGKSPVRALKRILLAAAAVTLMVVALQFLAATPAEHFDHAITHTAMRPIEGRLSGVIYKEYITRRGAAEPMPLPLRAFAEAVLVSRTSSTASDWHRRGIAHLVEGNASAAMASLIRAASLNPGEARYWSDLAAVRIAIGTAHKDDRLLREACEDASRAVRIKPDLDEARFNSAVALERRRLKTEAAAAFDRYLESDPQSPWASEVRLRRAKLHR